MQLNQKGDCLLLITEGVAMIVHDLGEAVPLQCFGHCWWSADEKSQWCFPCMGYRLTVLPQEAVQTFPFQHLFKQIKESRDHDPLIEPYSLFSKFSQSSIIDLEWRNQLFIPVYAWKMYEHVIYMMNSPFEGWHMVVTLVWWKKNHDFCPNSTMKLFWVTTIVSPTSLEFKMFQEGFALMQITIAHTT